MNDVFKKWLDELKTQGKSDEEIGKLLSGVAKLSAMEIYMALMMSLTEEDMQEVEKIEDEEEAKKKMEELFKLRTGMTVEELAKNIKEGFAEGYLGK